jgi:hypothetical protein
MYSLKHNATHILIVAFLGLIPVTQASAERAFYCNATDAVLTAFYTVPNDPIYTQNVNPAYPSLKFLRKGNSILIKHKHDVEMEIVPLMYRKGRDYFFARDDGMSTFEYSDGKVIYNMYGTIIAYDCDKF